MATFPQAGYAYTPPTQSQISTMKPATTASAGGGLAAAQFGLSALQGLNSIFAGYAAKYESKINAEILKGKAAMIDIQKGFEKRKYQRAMGQALSTSTAIVGGMGVKMSGSPLAAILDMQTEMELDMNISQFNLEQQKRYTLQEAKSQIRLGKQAVRSGWTQGLMQTLQGGVSYAQATGK